MTNEEAVRVIGNLTLYHDDDNEIIEALNMAIEALKRPKVTYICKDKGTEYCHHTSDITMARNFEKVGYNAYEEMER